MYFRDNMRYIPSGAECSVRKNLNRNGGSGSFTPFLHFWEYYAYLYRLIVPQKWLHTLPELFQQSSFQPNALVSFYYFLINRLFLLIHRISTHSVRCEVFCPHQWKLSWGSIPPEPGVSVALNSSNTWYLGKLGFCDMFGSVTCVLRACASTLWGTPLSLTTLAWYLDISVYPRWAWGSNIRLVSRDAK